MREKETAINDLLKDEKKFKELIEPVSAYIIFCEEDSKILALKNRSNKLILGKLLKFKDASEPTDIIWENRHFTKADYIKR